MTRLARAIPHLVGVAAIVATALMTSSLPVTSASVDNDDWHHHRHGERD